MKFINKGEKRIKVRTGKRFNSTWITVKPGETIDLPKDKGKRYELSAQKSPTVTEGKIGKKKVETKQLEDFSKIKVPEFEKELTNIKGIGAKIAWDITKVYPSKKDLIKAIKSKEHIPFRDDVVEKLKRWQAH